MSDALARLRGVRRTTGSVDAFEARAVDLGWRCIVLDGTEVEDKDAFLESCEDAFELPDWFGMNWDALEECLGDLDHDGAAGVVVIWSGWGEFAEAAPKDFAVALDVLSGAVRGWTADGADGGLLLLGSGPDVDVDDL